MNTVVMTKDEPGLSPESPSNQNRFASLSSDAHAEFVTPTPIPRSAYSLELHIGELVLHGFANGDRYRIGDALERELTRLFSEQGAPTAITNGRGIARVDGGAFEVTPESSAETMGIQLAQAIYGGLRQ